MVLAVCGLFAIISVGAGLSGTWISSVVSGFAAGLLTARAILDTGLATARLRDILKRSGAS